MKDAVRLENEKKGNGVQKVKNTVIWDKEKKAHGMQMVEKLKSFYNDKTMCDVTLKAGDYSVQAHKVVLSTASDYFLAMFSGHWSEQQENEIMLHELTPAGLKAVVEFVYKGEITFGLEDISEILAAVHHCQVVLAYKVCEDYIIEHLDESNFYDLIEVSAMYNMTALHEKLVEFAASLFMPKFPIGENCCFLNQLDLLSPAFVKQVVKKWDYSSAKCGKIGACDIIASWVKCNMAKRGHMLADLLSAIMEDTADMAEVMWYVGLKQEDKILEANKEESRLVSGSRLEDFITPADNLFTYDLDENTVRKTAVLPLTGKSLEGCCYVALDNVLYMLRGSNFLADTHYVCCKYDPCLDRWFPIEPLQKVRDCCSAMAWEGKIFVCGGNDSSEKILDTVDIYDPSTDTWSEGVPMPTPSRRHAVATYQGNVYVSGGEVSKKTYSKQFLCFDPKTSAWTEKEEMNLERKDHVAVTHKDRIYQIDGIQEGLLYTPDVPLIEYYDFSLPSGHWTGITMVQDLADVHIDGGVSIGDFMYFCASREVDYDDDDKVDIRFRLFRFESDHHQKVQVLEREGDSDDPQQTSWNSLKFPKVVFESLPSLKRLKGLK